MSESQFFRTVIQVEVLSDQPYSPGSLSDVAYDITEGDCSGKWRVVESVSLTEFEMAQAMKRQGSDPEFFGIEEEECEATEPVLNDAQLVVLKTYAGGDFAHLSEVKTKQELGEELEKCGDGLLRFLMVELASSEDCGSIEEANNRIYKAIRDLQTVESAL